jgi:hypothetical protein
MDKALLSSFVNKWLACWKGNRPDLLVEFYADDVFYIDHAHPNGMHGK